MRDRSNAPFARPTFTPAVILTTFVVGILLWCCQTAYAQVALWHANGNALDSIGTLHGSPSVGVSYTAGKLLEAFNFDGDDYVENLALTSIQNNFSYCFWAKPRSSREVTLESAGGSTGTGGQRYAIMPLLSSVETDSIAGVSVGTNGISVFEHSGNYMPSLLVYNTSITEWTHVVIVYKNKQPTLYLNGIPVRTGLTSLKSKVSPSAMLGGGTSGAATGFYNGLLDEVALYSTALDDWQVSVLYEEQFPVFVNSTYIVAPSISVRGPAQISFQLIFTEPTTLYSLDGSDPAVFGFLYSGPFTVKRSCNIRAVQFNSDFSKSFASNPLQLTVLPTLTPLSDGGGSITIDPPSGAYGPDQVATCTAVPASGWVFLQWLGDLSGTDPSGQVHVTTNRTVKAVFGTALHTNVIGSGSVQLDPPGTLYPFGSTVGVSARPSAGSYFVRWAGASAATNNPLVLPITNADPNLTAVFALLPPQDYSLAVAVAGKGHVDLSPQGSRFNKATNVVLTAIPEPGQTFLGWSGDATGDLNPLTILMSQSRLITANFSERPSLEYQAPINGLSDAGFRFSVLGDFSAAYRIDRLTTDWTWETVGWLTNTYGVSQFLDPAATNRPAAAYRALLP